MEVLTGKVVNREQEKTDEPVKEVELFTNPVAVNRIKLSFGAVPVVQLVLTAVCAGVLWYLKGGSETAAMAEEIIRRLTGG